MSEGNESLMVRDYILSENEAQWSAFKLPQLPNAECILATPSLKKRWQNLGNKKTPRCSHELFSHVHHRGVCRHRNLKQPRLSLSLATASAVSALNSSMSCAMRLKGKDDCNYRRRGGPRKSTPPEPAHRWEAARGEWIKIKFMDLRSARARPPFAGGAEVLIAVWPGLVLCEDGTCWYKQSVSGGGGV